MTSTIVAGALVTILVSSLTAAAQTAPSRPPETGPLEIRRSERDTARAVVKPPRAADVREAERAAAEYERTRREQSLIREQTRRARQRPDLGYDVSTSIQQRAIPRPR